jgi:hypothetical protein
MLIVTGGYDFDYPYQISHQIMFRKFLIRDEDQFVDSRFPELEESLTRIVEQLTSYSSEAKTEMILSFVKHHSISSQLVNDHPELATLISSKSLPLQVLEELFESSKQNSLFRKQLEDHIRKFFLEKKL